jgi:zinc ribbon protein
LQRSTAISFHFAALYGRELLASDAGQPGGNGSGQREAGPDRARRQAERAPDAPSSDASLASKLTRSARRPDLTELHYRARGALVDMISPDETVLVVIHGLNGSAIIGTERKALVFKTGARAGAPFGYRLKPFEYESILRIDVHPGAGPDVVVIHAPLKIASCSSYWVDERDDPWKARNAIPVELPNRRVDEGAALLADLVAEFQDEHARPGQFPERKAPADKPQTPELGGRREQRDRKRRSATPVVAAGPSMEDCSKCGARLRVSWQFCPRCGTPAGSGRHSDERRRSSSV